MSLETLSPPRWVRWILPQPHLLVSIAMYFGVLLTFFLRRSQRDLTLLHPDVVIVTLGIVLLLCLDRLQEYVFRQKQVHRYAALYFIALRVVLIEVVSYADQYQFSTFLYLLIPFVGWSDLGSKIGYGLAGFVWMVYFARFVQCTNCAANVHSTDNLLLFTIGLIFVLTVSNGMVQEKASRQRAETLLRDLDNTHQQLKAYAEQIEELATTKERNRLARDIHDSLGHYLTVINVQLEKAVAYRTLKPDEADQAVSDAKRIASEALREVRRSVGALRNAGESFHFTAEVARLVQNIRSSSLRVTFDVDGSPERMSRQILETLYRAVQEGLTNAQKHAAASHIHIAAQFGADEARLVIADDGTGFDPQNIAAQTGGSFGLFGVRERLMFVNGELTIESGSGRGTRLVIRIPNPVAQPMNQEMKAAAL
jgi:signal transduction histidine kinase